MTSGNVVIPTTWVEVAGVEPARAIRARSWSGHVSAGQVLLFGVREYPRMTVKTRDSVSRCVISVSRPVSRPAGERDDRSRRGRALAAQGVELLREPFLCSLEEVPVDAQRDRRVGVAHALRYLQGVGSLLDQEACVGVAEVVGPEGLWKPRGEERRANEVVAQHRNLEASETLHGVEQRSGRCPIVWVPAGEH